MRTSEFMKDSRDVIMTESGVMLHKIIIARRGISHVAALHQDARRDKATVTCGRDATPHW